MPLRRDRHDYRQQRRTQVTRLKSESLERIVSDQLVCRPELSLLYVEPPRLGERKDGPVEGLGEGRPNLAEANARHEPPFPRNRARLLLREPPQELIPADWLVAKLGDHEPLHPSGPP